MSKERKVKNATPTGLVISRPEERRTQRSIGDIWGWADMMPVDDAFAIRKDLFDDDDCAL